MLFHSSDHLVDRASVIALAAPASLAQIAFPRTTPWNGAASGSLVLAAGVLAIVAATSVGSGALYLAGSAVAGAGFGVAFLRRAESAFGVYPRRTSRRGHVGLLHRGDCSLSLPA